MLRRAAGTFIGANGGATRRVARDGIGKLLQQQQQPWKSRRVSTRVPQLSNPVLSLLWAQRLSSIKEISTKRVGPFRASLIPVKRPFHSTRARRAAAEPTTLGGRLKKLSREYGWTAVGLYMALSVLDFPFCFLLVRAVGTEKIAEVEHVVVSNVKKFIPEQVRTAWHEWRHGREEEGQGEAANTVPEGAGWGVKEADERKAQEGASLATQLALAYAVHKSFIFVRVPLTAAILPKVVKVLRSWGWEIGKRRARR